MGTKAGTLLWNRRALRGDLALPAGITPIDTGLRQVSQGFPAMSPGEPSLGVEAAPPGPPDGTPPASRIQVIPLSPIANWINVTHGEPFVNLATGTVWVTFSNNNEGPISINVLFWNPHSIVGPGEAATYNEPNT